MQAIILAAGRGLRLSPITDTIPKCLVEINGKSFLINGLDALSMHKEISEVIIVTGYKKEMIYKLVGDSYKGLKIKYVENKIWDKTNNIYSLWMASDYIKEDFILLEGDVFFELKLIDLIFKQKDKNLVFVSHYEPYMEGTVVTIDDKHRILRLIPKAEQGEEFDYSNTFKTINIYFFKYEMFKKYFKPNLNLYIENHDLDGYWELILGVLIYLRTPNLYVNLITNIKWYEVDDQNDLDAANYLFSDSKEQLNFISNKFGGHWRDNFIDYCFLFNLYFPPKDFYMILNRELNKLIGNYPSTQKIIARSLSKWYKEESFNENNLFIGNGASEFIRILNRNLIKKITIPVPTFNEYEDIENEKINNFILKENQDYDLNIDAFITSVINSNSNVALIINPNNPTGRAVLKDDILKILDNLKRLDGIIIDESFIDFTGNREDFSCQKLVNQYSNLIIIRSLSKEFGIPGLRIGYLLTKNDNIKATINRYLPIWNINSLAERFIELFPNYKDQYNDSIKKIINDRDDFILKLREFSFLKPYNSFTNFILCKVINNKTSEDLTHFLFKKGFFIKDCSNKTSLGNKFVRIAVRTKDENDKLIKALENF